MAGSPILREARPNPKVRMDIDGNFPSTG